MTTTSSLGISRSELNRLGGQPTAREIAQQPQLWLETFKALLQRQKAVADFLNRIYSLPDIRIILSGAGTSAFLGDILQGIFQKHSGHNVQAVATTDLVSHPHLFSIHGYPL